MVIAPAPVPALAPAPAPAPAPILAPRDAHALAHISTTTANPAGTVINTAVAPHTPDAACTPSNVDLADTALPSTRALTNVGTIELATNPACIPAGTELNLSRAAVVPTANMKDTSDGVAPARVDAHLSSASTTSNAAIGNSVVVDTALTLAPTDEPPVVQGARGCGRGRGRGRGGARGRGSTCGQVTARALCKVDYMSKHPSATSGAYATYWKSLKGTEEEKLWLKQADDARVAQDEAAT
ncbi:hypothetical protein FISHEDRAFT_74841 [Fistulina hepatica ATCC 64428]|uniref:Uncharacterized protein n=1 Tax=Fistulina hepatica ATCC 64428 TaxID=1128425 RepID=A0A0D7A8V6_9AGAR|nr:hypothetical protein FISHEDRAFT_74841 [Fistulina hepatica ATCC 64428]